MSVRYVAFLRAVNVGGRVVKMDRLRTVFESMGFEDVATFIASGNVIFEAKARSEVALRARIEGALEDAFGFAIPVILRTNADLARIAGHEPLGPAQRAVAVASNVALLEREPDAAARARLMALQTEIDAFEVSGREVYWLCRARQSDSRFSNAALEKALGMTSTMRSASTIAKLAAKLAPG